METDKQAQELLQKKFDGLKSELLEQLREENGQQEIKNAKQGLQSTKGGLRPNTKALEGLRNSLIGKNSSVTIGSLPIARKDFTGAAGIFNEVPENITRTVGNFGSDYQLARNPATERIPSFDLFNNSGVTLIPVSGTNSPYVDEVTTGEADVQNPEGSNKAEIEVEYHETVAAVKTYAAIMRASDQMLEDLPALESWINSILRRKLQNKYNADFFTGTGADGRTDSLETLSTELVAANFATNQGVAGIADVINAALTQVSLNYFQPDSIFMNPIDFYKMMAERAGDEHYISGVAQFRNYLFDNPFIARIWLTNYVAENTMYVNEIGLVNTLFKANKFNLPEMGLNGEDFKQNMMSIRAHVRIENVCPTNHRGGLIKVSDIATAISDIAGTVPV